jgi:hypothetical protein
MNYHTDYEFLSKSFLTKFELSAAHAEAYMKGEKKDTPAMLFGRIYHASVAGLFDQFSIIDPEKRPEPDKTMASTLNKAWKATFTGDCIDIEDYVRKNHSGQRSTGERSNASPTGCR